MTLLVHFTWSFLYLSQSLLYSSLLLVPLQSVLLTRISHGLLFILTTFLIPSLPSSTSISVPCTLASPSRTCLSPLFLYVPFYYLCQRSFYLAGPSALTSRPFFLAGEGSEEEGDGPLTGVEDNSPPIILEDPQDAYVIKNKPATLTCRAAHALKGKLEGVGKPGSADWHTHARMHTQVDLDFFFHGKGNWLKTKHEW